MAWACHWARNSSSIPRRKKIEGVGYNYGNEWSLDSMNALHVRGAILCRMKSHPDIDNLIYRC